MKVFARNVLGYEKIATPCHWAVSARFSCQVVTLCCADGNCQNNRELAYKTHASGSVGKLLEPPADAH